MSDKRFNIRVYGILISERNEVLLADERIAGMEFTKFPGGGLEFGEGTMDCLKRECMEEMNQPIEVLEHVYTTDYFQASAFNDNHQLVSIYYRITLAGPQQFSTISTPFDLPEGPEVEAFRWKALSELTPDDVRWPVDKKVASLIVKRYGL